MDNEANWFIGLILLGCVLVLAMYHSGNEAECKKLCGVERSNYSSGYYEGSKCYCEKNGALYLKKVW